MVTGQYRDADVPGALVSGWPSLTAVPVWDHLWPRRATFFPPRMDHLFSVDHFFPTLYRDLGPPKIFGWWPPWLGRTNHLEGEMLKYHILPQGVTQRCFTRVEERHEKEIWDSGNIGNALMQLNTRYGKQGETLFRMPHMRTPEVAATSQRRRNVQRSVALLRSEEERRIIGETVRSRAKHAARNAEDTEHEKWMMQGEVTGTSGAQSMEETRQVLLRISDQDDEPPQETLQPTTQLSPR